MIYSAMSEVCHYRLSQAIDAHKSVPLELNHFIQLFCNPGFA